MTEDEVYERFRAAVKTEGVRGFARRVGFTPSYISDMMHERRALSDRVLASINVVRTVSTIVIYHDNQTDSGAHSGPATRTDPPTPHQDAE